ncbi:stage II sporulation protein E [Leptospira ryugenii]|uniref:Stage II sporulation protein E n=1 Tax=Leptospira ryugenii TaxID=1917863 RepID=A0A2P2E459_9LEPT|nr:stage II sporulation protein E [Leptospira ryugenii]
MFPLDLAKDKNQYTHSFGKIPNFGNTDKTYLFCYQIKNDTQVAHDLVVFIKYPLLDHVQFFETTNGTFVTFPAQGRLYSFFAREKRYRGFSHELELSPQETKQIWVLVSTESSMSVPLFVAKEKDFSHFVSDDFLIQGFYFGIVSVMTFYNFFVFLLIRDKAYLYYVIYLLFGSIAFQLSLNGILPMYFFPNQPALVWNLHNIIYYLFLFFSFPMSMTFMNLKENSPKLFLIFQMGMYISLLGLFLIPFLPYRLLNASGDIYSLCLAILGISASSYIAFSVKFRPAYFFFFAFLFVIIGGLGTLMKYMGVLPVNPFTENAFQIAMAIEVILMAFGLGDRISIVRKENERTQIKAEIDKQKLLAFQKELLLAKKLQESTLPSKVNHPEIVEVNAGYLPASLVGGDFYDIVKLSETEIICLIADVTGHGVPAAIEAAMLKIAFTQSLRFATSPSLVLNRINRSLVGTYQNQLLTAAALYINLEHKYFRIANAGHPPLYHVKQNSNVILPIRPKGKLIGLSKDLEFHEEEYELATHDQFFLFTDGLWDVWERDERGEKESEGKGEELFLEWMHSHMELSADQLHAKLEAFIKTRTTYIPPEDDITFILFSVRP